MDYLEIKNKFSASLFKKRVIYIDEITYSSAELIGKMITWLNVKNSKEIIVYIDCSGGKIGPGFDIYDKLKESAAPITGKVYSKARSMAIIVLQGCKKRQIMKHGNLGFHKIEIELKGEMENIKKIVDGDSKEAQEYEEYQKEYYRIIAERSSLSTIRIQEFCELKCELSAQEALDFGLVDEII